MSLTRAFLLPAILVTGAAQFAAAGLFVSAELPTQTTNNTLGTAEAIPGSAFTTPVPPTVFDPPGWATATVTATGAGGDVDFYSFTTLGGGAFFDIDNDPFVFDTILSLFDSTGTLLAYDDDSFPEDSGTAFGYDSFLGVLTLAPGTYYVTVSQFSNFPTQLSFVTGATSLVRPDGEFGGSGDLAGVTPGDSSFPVSGSDGGAPYTLHISLENPANAEAIPEPASWALLAFGGLGAIAHRRRRGRRAA